MSIEYPPPYHIPELDSHEWFNWLSNMDGFVRSGAELDFFQAENSNVVTANAGVWETVVSTGSITIVRKPTAIILGNAFMNASGGGATIAGMQHRILKDGATVLHTRLYNRPNIEFYDADALGTHEYELQRYVSAGWATYQNCSITVYTI